MLTTKKHQETTANTGAKAGLFFQPKLTVNAPNDRYEQEADAMADRVMRMKDPTTSDAFFTPAVLPIQRKCKHCEEEENHVHRKESGTRAPNVNAGFENYVSSLGIRGKPLSAQERSFFEPRFNRDFSDVRVHTDSEAAHSAQGINALAYTSGNNIVFNSGQYQPGSDYGKRLLAHELTHVVQQSTTIGRTVQRTVKNQGCLVHAYDGSDPKDKAVVFERGVWDDFLGNNYPYVFGVSNVDDLVTKTNAYINDNSNECDCVGKLEINGHGTAGYQSVGNGIKYVNDDKALVHDSAEAHLKKLKEIKFCNSSVIILGGCHAGANEEGKKLMKRISNMLPGALVGGAEHFTIGTGPGKKKVVNDDSEVGKDNTISPSKATEFMKSKNVRWYFTDAEGKEYTSGTDHDPADLTMKIKSADKVKIVTPEGETIKIK